ncbi:hypothetical protein VNI00_007664 [Paramarasmius palmivorus]|uniref:Uncharacterized protein n=1 Tax=Paramarasmius palmivorus TaxID=297713 RepID=A0AAW0D049_9AGAR
MADLSEDLKNLLHQLVRPLILSSLNRGIVAPSVTSVQLDDSPVLSPDTGSENHLPFPHASSAAIVLSLALHETNNIQIPPHLPINRTTAQSSGRSGPTMEDYRIIAAYKTALFGDDRPLMNKLLGTECDRSRSKRHDPDFHQKMGCGPAPLGAYSYSYIGRFLEGVWEGYYMVSSLNSTTGSGSWKEGASDPPDFLCRRPMQCSLALYYHFDDQQSEVLDCIEEEVVNWSVRACDFSASGTRLELSGVVLPYEKLTGAEDCDHKRLSEANDCLIVGQTLEEHGEAWGAFTFAGRVHRDGRITLKREPRHSSEAGLGTWIFQGHLRFGAAFVGTWSSSSTRDQPGVCGLFSMGKK